MRVADGWKEYEVLDTSAGEKLERWGDVLLIRPDPQILWDTPRQLAEWGQAHARYLRSREGGGRWQIHRQPPADWPLHHDDLTFKVSPTGFKHTGLFPEQAVNWRFIRRRIRSAGRPVRVLNLFAYTGGATLAAAAAGASVCHVDAAKGMVAWARENAALSGLQQRPIRWIVDDCAKFVEREIRRGNRYDAIIMDPPSYGRGPGGEVWKLETEIYRLAELCAQVLSDAPLFLLLNSYTTGLSAGVMRYVLGVTVARRHGGSVSADEIGLPVRASGLTLPCGSTAVWQCAGSESVEETDARDD